MTTRTKHLGLKVTCLSDVNVIPDLVGVLLFSEWLALISHLQPMAQSPQGWLEPPHPLHSSTTSRLGGTRGLSSTNLAPVIKTSFVFIRIVYRRKQLNKQPTSRDVMFSSDKPLSLFFFTFFKSILFMSSCDASE